MKETVRLIEVEKHQVHMFVHRGKAIARTITRARVLLKLAEGWSDEHITTAFEICRATVSNVRKRFDVYKDRALAR